MASRPVASTAADHAPGQQDFIDQIGSHKPIVGLGSKKVPHPISCGGLIRSASQLLAASGGGLHCLHRGGSPVMLLQMRNRRVGRTIWAGDASA